jgi:transport family protein 27
MAPLVLRAKCVVVGDAAVGKTALVQNFVSDGTKFPKNYSMTMGVDIQVKAVHIPDTQTTVELYIYDTAGKGVFADFVPEYWENPGLVMVAYDVSQGESFESCVKWLERVRAQKPAVETQLPGVLVACKCDLEARREVSEERGRELAASKDLVYFETSAVRELFNT